MAKLTPEQIADKQVARSVAAVADYKQGVQAVTVSPTAKAAQNLDKYLEKTAEAVNSGKMAANLNSVTLQSWQDSTVNKGGSRYASGVQAAKAKIANFQRQIAPFRDALSAQVQAMPKKTLEDSLARVEANIRGMSKFKYRKNQA